MEKTRKCPKCGKIVSQYTYFCTECGTRTEETEERVQLQKETMISTQEKDNSGKILKDKEEIGISNVPITTVKNDSGIGFPKKTIGIAVGVLIGIIGVMYIFSIGGNNFSTVETQDASNMENISDVDYEDSNMVNSYGGDNALEYAGSVESIGIPDWFIVNAVVVNGNEMCYSRDDILPTSTGECPLSVIYYIFNDDGSLYSMTGYMIYDSKETARQYADKLNSYNNKDENEFGMQLGETRYYSVENVLVEEYLPQYTKYYVGTMEDEISMYSREGFTINYNSSNQIQLEASDEDSLAETGYTPWIADIFCYSDSDYTFLLDDSAQEVITPTFEVVDESVVICTVAELVKADSYVTDNFRYYYVELYDATTDDFVDGYSGIYDYNEGGVEFYVNNIDHSYYLKIITDLESDERIYGHGHIIR